jgi:DNA polymerase-3 subunit gamma/tau
MAYLVLARKYRPQLFEEVIGQDHVTQTLSHALAAGRVAHAGLFAGPRGTGKTSVARILAKALNCERGPTPTPCNRCRCCREITGGSSVDVYEIDGASNNSVDQVRELRENIKYMPAHSRFKIYIIDEVHMLSTAAFNALLKTLEEPPEHIVFLFATTEPHKIPITILSRCQRHDFRRIRASAIVQHMTDLCGREGIVCDSATLELLAREAEGSMRDALSLLDQAATALEGNLSHEGVLEMLGVADRRLLLDMAEILLNGRSAAMLELIDALYDRGCDLQRFYADLLLYFRHMVVAKAGGDSDKLLDLPQEEMQRLQDLTRDIAAVHLQQLFDQLYQQWPGVRQAAHPRLALETALLRLLPFKPALSIETLIEKLEALRREMSDGGAGKVAETQAPYGDKARAAPAADDSPAGEAARPAATTEDEPSPPVAPQAKIKAPSPEQGARVWQQVCQQVARKHPSLGAALARSQLKQLGPNRLEVEVCGNGFSIGLIKRERNLAKLRRTCRELFGEDREIVVTGKEEPDKTPRQARRARKLEQKALADPLVAEAMEVFDGQLVDVKIDKEVSR